MQRRRCLSLLPGAVAAAWPALGRAQTAAPDARIVLGQSAPFSGPAAQLGVQFHWLNAVLHGT